MGGPFFPKPLYEPIGAVNITEDVCTVPFLWMHNSENRNQHECKVEVEQKTYKSNTGGRKNARCPTRVFVFLGQPNHDEMDLFRYMNGFLGLDDLDQDDKEDAYDAQHDLLAQNDVVPFDRETAPQAIQHSTEPHPRPADDPIEAFVE